MFWLLAEIHLSDNGSLYLEKLQRHAPYRIMQFSINGASTIVSFASWVIHVPIGCRHPFNRYSLPVLGNTTATCSLLHPENERQLIINNLQLWIVGNWFSDWLQASIYQILAAFTGNNTATCSLPHPENECQRSVNNFSCCIFGNQDITLISAFITE